jgi:hypothetical protein
MAPKPKPSPDHIYDNVLLPFDGKINNLFGASVSYHGDTIAVGSINADTRGAVYVFASVNNVTSQWKFQQKLIEPSAPLVSKTKPLPFQSNFGSATALNSKYLLIGSDQKLSSNSGSIYVYNRKLNSVENSTTAKPQNEEWMYSQQIQSSDSLKNFGHKLAIAETLFITSSEKASIDGTGAAYIYKYDTFSSRYS